MGKKCFMFAVVSVFILTGPVFAQDKKKDTTIPTMEEVVVTATKTEEKRKDIANSVVIIDSMDIDEAAAQSLGELMANEPGIDWRSQGNYGGATQEIHLRGMKGNGTQVFVNGVNYNSPSVGMADVSRIPLNNIDRIEVVKGSGSLLYGSGAIGGTISIETKRPERDQIDAIISAGYGSENTYKVSAEHGMFAYEDFGYYLTANRTETDGFRDNSDLIHNDVSLKLVLEKGKALDISLYGDFIDREYGRPGVQPPKGTQDYFINGTQFISSEAASLLDEGNDEDSHIALEAKGSPLEWLSYNVKANYTSMENYSYSRYSYDGSGNKSWTTNNIFGTEGNITVSPFSDAKVLMGSEYKKYDWKNKGVGLDSSGHEDNSTLASNKADIDTTGLFTEVQYRPFTFFKFLAGIRNEYHSEFGSENLPRFGLIFNPWEDTAVKVTHGKHFLAPTPNDLFYPYEDWGWGMGAEGNLDLKPEIGWHSDITVEQALLANKLFLTGTYFNWDMDDRILWTDNGTGFWRPENLKSYEAHGFELGSNIGPYYNMTIRLNYTYLNAEEEAEEYSRVTPGDQKTWKKHRATYSPEHLFKGALVYQTPFDMTASLTLRYVSERAWYRNETDDYVNYKTVVYELDAYTTADIKIEQRMYDDWLLSLQGNNLFDEKYDTYFSTFTDPNTFETLVAGYPGAGRSIFFSVSYQY